MLVRRHDTHRYTNCARASAKVRIPAPEAHEQFDCKSRGISSTSSRKIVPWFRQFKSSDAPINRAGKGAFPCRRARFPADPWEVPRNSLLLPAYAHGVRSGYGMALLSVLCPCRFRHRSDSRVCSCNCLNFLQDALEGGAVTNNLFEVVFSANLLFEVKLFSLVGS